jgi:hypothetical protein
VIAVRVEVKDNGKIGRIRLQILENASGKELMGNLYQNVAEGSHVVTDRWKGYGKVEATGYTHELDVNKENSKTVLPHAHPSVNTI